METMTITATYSPEDNKLRLYASARLDAETFSRVKGAGFRWAPKQELFVAPAWSPDREDLAIELAGDIEPEEMTLAERAAIKAERLDNLAMKRNAQANAFARRADELSQTFYMGQPILVGHHSERKARKTKERMQGAMSAANKAEKASNYWLYRATGVEAFANMKNSPRTRANRIKTLLAELRDLQRAINKAHSNLAMWQNVTDDDDIKKIIGHYDIAPTAIYYKVKDGEMTPHGAREWCIKKEELTINGPKRRRWIEHILNRLSFERSMLGDVPRYEGDITPVIIQAFAREHGAEKPKCTEIEPGSFQLESPVPLPLHLSDNSYLEMSADEWRDMMQSTGYVVPARKDALPPILNLDVAEHTSPNPYDRQTGVSVWRVVKTDKATYSKIPNDYRGVRPSSCGRYRFKVANGRSVCPDAKPHEYVAIFLTDSKIHTLETDA